MANSGAKEAPIKYRKFSYCCMEKKQARKMETRQMTIKIIFVSMRGNRYLKQRLAEFVGTKFVVTVDSNITISAIIPSPDMEKMSHIPVV